MKKLQLFCLLAFLPLCGLADLNSGLVCFYEFDGNGSNSAGPGFTMTNNGVAYAPGLHGGLAAMFDGSDQHFSTLENFPITNAAARSISVWLKPANIVGLDGNILKWGNWLQRSRAWGFFLQPPSYGHATVSANYLTYSSGPDPFAYSYGEWIHIVATWQSNDPSALFYVNGTYAGGYISDSGDPVNTDAGRFLVGYIAERPPDGGWASPYVGLIDDLRVYNRVLTPDEVATLANIQLPPKIMSQPQGTVGFWGGTAQFQVDVKANPDPSYLWYKDGFPVSWATNWTLNLSNLDFPDAGTYTVVVSNSEGSVTSSPPALLVVNPAGISIGLYPFLTIQGSVGKTFGIQCATTVSQTNSWTVLTNITLTQPVQIWIDTSVDASPGHGPARFYRIIAVPSQ